MSGRYPINDPFLATYGILLIVTIGFVILGIAGVAYFFFFPEINNISKNPKSIDVDSNGNVWFCTTVGVFKIAPD